MRSFTFTSSANLELGALLYDSPLFYTMGKAIERDVMMEDLNQRDAERRRYEERNDAQMGGEPVLPSYIRRQEREESQRYIREWEQGQKVKDPALPGASSELQVPQRDREGPRTDQEKRPSE